MCNIERVSFLLFGCRSLRVLLKFSILSRREMFCSFAFFLKRSLIQVGHSSLIFHSCFTEWVLELSAVSSLAVGSLLCDVCLIPNGNIPWLVLQMPHNAFLEFLHCSHTLQVPSEEAKGQICLFTYHVYVVFPNETADGVKNKNCYFLCLTSILISASSLLLIRTRTECGERDSSI